MYHIYRINISITRGNLLPNIMNALKCCLKLKHSKALNGQKAYKGVKKGLSKTIAWTNILAYIKL